MVVVKCLVHLSNCFSDLIRLPDLTLYLIAFPMVLASVSTLRHIVQVTVRVAIINVQLPFAKDVRLVHHVT